MTGPRLSIIPARAATDPNLKPRDLQVLCVFGRHTDDLGWCSRSQVKMAREIGCARSTVFEAIERLMRAGYLERYEQPQENGRDCPHIYRVVLDLKHPDPTSIVADIEEPEDPADQSAPPAGISAPPADPGPAPKNDPFRTKREACASEPEERLAADVATSADDPKKFEARVKRLAARLDWPHWAKSSTAWTVARFAELTDAERTAAEARGAAYLAHCGKAALSLGTYFHERKWVDLPAAVIAAAEAPPPVLAPPFGKVWNAIRTRLLFGKHARLPKGSAFLETLMAEDSERGERERLAHRARYGWPVVNRMHEAAEHGAGWQVSDADAALAELAAGFEQVWVGTELWEAWKAVHERNGWPWLPDPGKQRVVYFPAGGPVEGLKAFEQAVRGNDVDGRAQAAE